MTRFPFRLLLLAALAAAAVAPARADAPAVPPLPLPVVQTAPRTPVWEARLASFDREYYDRAVEALMEKYEAAARLNPAMRPLAPGAKKRVGLKVYTDSGQGLATPIPLVQAVIAALERRGFENVLRGRRGADIRVTQPVRKGLHRIHCGRPGHLLPALAEEGEGRHVFEYGILEANLG